MSRKSIVKPIFDHESQLKAINSAESKKSSLHFKQGEGQSQRAKLCQISTGHGHILPSFVPLIGLERNRKVSVKKKSSVNRTSRLHSNVLHKKVAHDIVK